MRLLVISDAPILSKEGTRQAYAPYVREMDMWMRQFAETQFLCPTHYRFNLLTTAFADQDFKVKSLKRLEFNTFYNGLLSCFAAPYQFFVLLVSMSRADHIHLRAPGNLCFLACIAQIFFRKPKTAKYAGNWDPDAEQPFLYKAQKKILSSTWLSENMKVLVYGKWSGQTKNIIPFFTATYNKTTEPLIDKTFSQPLKALFVGTMGPNKRPLETVKMVHDLRRRGINISLDMYGTGSEETQLEDYIQKNSLEGSIVLHGNQPSEVVREAYKQGHFLILLSKSEGWPKVVAEAMYWGAIPIASPVSCVPWMLGQGDRGFLISQDIPESLQLLSRKFENPEGLNEMSNRAQKWSRKYTLESFEDAIKEMI